MTTDWADVVAEEELARRSSASSDVGNGLLVRASDVPVERTTFLMTPYVPTDALTVVAGIGGLGKSHFVLELAARASRGQLEGDLQGEPVAVVIATAEDAHSQTIIPRLLAAGADLDRVFLIRQDAEFRLDDLSALDEAMSRHQARLLVLDPIVAYVPTKLDAHKDQHARAVLSPLAALAAKHHAAVIAVMHLNKAADAGSMFLRVSSSIGFLNAARSGLLFAPDPQDDKLRVLAHGKANLSEPGPSRRFRIEGTQVPRVDGEMVDTSRIVWLGASKHTVADLLRTDHRAEPRERAEGWLSDRLADGPALHQVLLAEADTAGISRRTLARARQDLGIAAVRTRTVPSRSVWGFTDHFDVDLQGALMPPASMGGDVAPLGTVEPVSAGQPTGAISHLRRGTSEAGTTGLGGPHA